MKHKEWPKVGETGQIINRQLEELPPPKVRVLPDIITREPTQADKEKAKKHLAVTTGDC